MAEPVAVMFETPEWGIVEMRAVWSVQSDGRLILVPAETVEVTGRNGDVVVLQRGSWVQVPMNRLLWFVTPAVEQPRPQPTVSPGRPGGIVRVS